MEKRKKIKGFVDFVREQGVVGLAVGFILGGSIKEVVSSLVEDVINPLLGAVLGGVSGLEMAVFKVGSVEIMWGSFVATLIDFLVIATVVYFGVKGLGLDRLDKSKEKK